MACTPRPADDQEDVVKYSSPDGQMLVAVSFMQVTLDLCLEFKRILDCLFEEPEMIESGVMAKFKVHYDKRRRQYYAQKRTFSDHLRRRMPNLDKGQLSRCFKGKCALSGHIDDFRLELSDVEEYFSSDEDIAN